MPTRLYAIVLPRSVSALSPIVFLPAPDPAAIVTPGPLLPSGRCVFLAVESDDVGRELVGLRRVAALLASMNKQAPA